MTCSPRGRPCCAAAAPDTPVSAPARRSRPAGKRAARGGALTLRSVITRLRAHYGRPEAPPTSDPFELILWENVAYLAAPARRREAFELLRSTVGTHPAGILSADVGTLERVTAGGILKETFAGKLRECAGLVMDRFGGDLADVVRRPAGEAVKALRAFAGIGVPGAEKILLFSGHQPLLAPESNGLRVLVRLGLLKENKSYARLYAAGRDLGTQLPARTAAMQEAHLLLQQHGQTLCRRRAPLCGSCPLAAGCAFAARQT